MKKMKNRTASPGKSALSGYEHGLCSGKDPVRQVIQSGFISKTNRFNSFILEPDPGALPFL